MNKEELFRNKLYSTSPTSLSIGSTSWIALDTKLVGRVNAMIKENKQLKEELEEEKRINVEDLKTIDRQQEIIQELKEKIDKAIKCINDYANIDDDYSKIYSTEEYDLLEILKGE